MSLTSWAAPNAERLLSPLGNRWRHVRQVAEQARRIVAVVPHEDRDLLVAAAYHRDLSDPDDRHYLRGEVAHACRSSDDTSRRLKDAMVDRARDGKPHTGSRRYGYSKDGMTILDDEAEVVRWIVQSFLDGMTPNAISNSLNRRGIPTALGRRWGSSQILRLLDSHHLAGLRVFRGAAIGPAMWPATAFLRGGCPPRSSGTPGLTGRS